MEKKDHNWPLIIGIIVFIIVVFFAIFFGAYLIFHYGDKVTSELPGGQTQSQQRTLARAEDLTGGGTAGSYGVGAGAGQAGVNANGGLYDGYSGYRTSYPAGDPRNTTGPDPRTATYNFEDPRTGLKAQTRQSLY